MDQIDRNSALSRDDKYRQRSEIAAQAIADLEASKTLALAREAVELAVANDKCEEQVSPEMPRQRSHVKAMKELEQGWRKAIDKIAERASLTKGPNMRRYSTGPLCWHKADIDSAVEHVRS